MPPGCLQRTCPGHNTVSKLNSVHFVNSIFDCSPMNKRAVIKKIVTKLMDELDVYLRAAQFSRAEATHESSKAENKYDTRGLEASYLARGQSKQALEIKSAITDFESLP